MELVRVVLLDREPLRFDAAVLVHVGLADRFFPATTDRIEAIGSNLLAFDQHAQPPHLRARRSRRGTS